MQTTLRKHFSQKEGGYQGADPLLIVTAVDVDAGNLATFDSARGVITPFEVMASCALPPSFPAQFHDGKRYWDGGLWSNTPLREALNVIQQSALFDMKSDNYSVYIADLFPRDSKPIKSNWELWGSINQITYADKTLFDEKITNRMNDYTSALPLIL